MVRGVPHTGRPITKLVLVGMVSASYLADSVMIMSTVQQD
jgi:hypothetical protein